MIVKHGEYKGGIGLTSPINTKIKIKFKEKNFDKTKHPKTTFIDAFETVIKIDYHSEYDGDEIEIILGRTKIKEKLIERHYSECKYKE